MRSFGIILSVILALIIAFGMWSLARWVNYRLSYEYAVTETIRETVKPECLKRGES